MRGDADVRRVARRLGLVAERWRKVINAELTRLAGDEKLHEELNYLAAYPCSDPDDKLLAYRQRTLDVIARILQQPDTVQDKDISSLGSPGNIGGAKAWGGNDAKIAYRRRLKAFVEKFSVLAVYFRSMGAADADAAGLRRGPLPPLAPRGFFF